jgi:hypothetical protein
VDGGMNLAATPCRDQRTATHIYDLLSTVDPCPDDMKISSWG